MRKVLQRVRERNLKLNRDKCKFGVTEITYIGHVLGRDGLKADPNKTAAVVRMPRPENKKGVEHLIGFMTHLTKFMPNLLKVTAPLRAVLKDETPWHWDSVHEETFRRLKELATHAPVLKL